MAHSHDTHHHAPGHGHTDGHTHGHGNHPDAETMATVLDLDATVNGHYLGEVCDRIAVLVPEPRTMLDLGSGTGTGTLALARRFGSSQVVALDNSAELLERVARAAQEAGLDGQVRTVTADLDSALPDHISDVDVAWASSTLHHFADAEALLRSTFRALRPGGVLAIVEIAEPPTFLPPDSADGEVEQRLREAILGKGWNGGWNGRPDWAPSITAADFEIVETRDIPTDLDNPPAAAADYAVEWLTRVRSGLTDDDASAEDLAAVDQLLHDDNPASLRRRNDLVVRSSRIAWIARRPENS
ncbi:class I SAM-dependent methyltransferase [Gordonia sp. DT101]|uniref:class I SAM-dependent methyltransferase n=1 Tax=Gordonia sp. DT101 TaxID=3416545 RepID=UPI003CF7732D